MPLAFEADDPEIVSFRVFVIVQQLIRIRDYLLTLGYFQEDILLLLMRDIAIEYIFDHFHDVLDRRQDLFQSLIIFLCVLVVEVLYLDARLLQKECHQIARFMVLNH